MTKWLMTCIAILFSTCVSAQNETDTRFLVLTDIHLDPFMACYKIKKQPCPLIQRLQAAPVSEWAAILQADGTSPQYYRDAPYSLLKTTLQAAKKESDHQQIKFVLVLGDLLAHKYRRHYKYYMQDKSRANYQAFARKTLIFINNEIAKTFPNVDIYSLVGNNDSYRGNYRAEVNSEFFNDMAVLWGSTIRQGNRNAMQSEFRKAGYYALTLPGEGRVRLIMLNSVLFSGKCQGNQIAEAAKQQLNWLHQQLLMAKENHQRVLLAMHIPEGIDVYPSMRIRILRIFELWHSEYIARIQAELKEFAPEIIGIFVGHLHVGWSNAERFGDMDEIPILGTQSISPVYGTDPGFRIYSYSDQTLRLNDIETYSYPLQ